MDLKEAIWQRRTIRKYQQRNIEGEFLTELVAAARLAPSAANLQPLAYLIIDDKEKLDQVFPLLSWAGYLAPHGAPQEGEKPMAYIIVLADRNVRAEGYAYDVGAAIQNMQLLALKEGIGCCWFRSVKRPEMQKTLAIPENYAIDSVLALGYKAQQAQAEEEQGSIRYYEDEKQILHVPKRKMADICFYNQIQ